MCYFGRTLAPIDGMDPAGRLGGSVLGPLFSFLVEPLLIPWDTGKLSVATRASPCGCANQDSCTVLWKEIQFPVFSTYQ